jgi:hypothetical protein
MIPALTACVLSLTPVFGAPPPTPPTPIDPAQRPEPPAPTALAAACADIRAEQSCEAATPNDAGLGCTCTIQAELPATALDRGQGGALTGAVALRVAGTSAESPGMIDTVHLVLRVEGRWVDFGEVASSYEPGAFGVHNEGRVTALALVTPDKKLADGVASTGALLWVTTENHHSDSDLGMNARVTNDVNAVLVCGPIAARVACVELATQTNDGLERVSAEEPAPPVESYGKVGDVRWSRVVTPVGDGRIKLATAKGKVPAVQRKLTGTHTLAALLALAPAGTTRDPLAPAAPATP